MTNLTTFPRIPMGTKVVVNSEKGSSAASYNGTEGVVTGRFDNGLLDVTVTDGFYYGEPTKVIDSCIGKVQMLGPLALWAEELQAL